MVNDWTLDDGRVIRLVTPDQLKNLAPGTKVLDIFGEVGVVGQTVLDDDTRFGYTAWGHLIKEAQDHE